MAKTPASPVSVSSPVAEPSPAVTASPVQPEKAKVSEKVQARRDAEKARRSVKVDIDTAGVVISKVHSFSKKAGSHAAKVVALYAEGKLVSKVLEEAKALDFEKAESYARACFLYDVRHGFIELSAPAKPEPKA